MNAGLYKTGLVFHILFGFNQLVAFWHYPNYG
jgi:hypothetical protein